jgi:hypothetical protein
MTRGTASARSSVSRSEGTSFRERWNPVRFGFTAGLTVFVLLAGTGVSYAWWQSTAGASSTSSAATVGVSQTLSGTPGLANTYTAAAPVAAGVVTVTNSSSRPGTYATNFTATSASSTLRPAVAVQVGTAASCTPSATLGSPVSGNFGSTVTYTGSLAAGASIALCVKTTMTSAAITANSAATLTATAASSVLVGTWSATAPQAVSFVQTVTTAPSSAIDSGAWYRVKKAASPERCAQLTYPGGTNTATTSPCDGNLSLATQLWRFTPTSGGYYKIVSKEAPSTWWSVPSAASGQPVQLSTATGTTQQWLAEKNADGTYSFKLRADNTLCATRTGSANGAPINVATCAANDAEQSFTLQMFETATPTPITLTCTGDGFTRYFSWPQLVGYQTEVVYRVLVGGSVSTVHTRATGYDTVAQFGSTATLGAYGAGLKSIEVQQSVAGAPWTQVGTSSLLISSTNPVLQCGS